MIPIDSPTYFAVELLETALYRAYGTSLMVGDKSAALYITHAIEHLCESGSIGLQEEAKYDA